MATRVDDRDAGTVVRSTVGASRWSWALRALPAIAFLATFGYFFVDKNEAARSVLDSPRGLLTIAAIVGGYVVIALVVRRFATWTWVAPLVLTAVVLALAAWLVRPYYVDKTDDTQLVRGPVANASEVVPNAPTVGSTEPPGSTPPAPVRVAAGSIQGLAGHDGSGQVSLIRVSDGSFVVRFESFDIEGVPAPVVYLIEGSDQRSPGGAKLGDLRGNQGTASDYAVPGHVTPGAGWSVLVWCETFSTPVVNATLTAV